MRDARAWRIEAPLRIPARGADAGYVTKSPAGLPSLAIFRQYA